MSTLAKAFELVDLPVDQAVGELRKGLPSSDFERVARAMNMSTQVLALKLGISPRTFRHQRKTDQNLSVEISEKLVRMARIRRIGRQIFTTDDALKQWLETPAPALNGLPPIDLLDTDLGAREVHSVLQGIAYGNVM